MSADHLAVRLNLIKKGVLYILHDDHRLHLWPSLGNPIVKPKERYDVLMASAIVQVRGLLCKDQLISSY
jgi:hypothetical protein